MSIQPMSLRFFSTLYWHEGEQELDPSRPHAVTLWEPLDTDAPEDAQPYCYLANDIDFRKPREKWPPDLTGEPFEDAICYDRHVKHYETSRGFGQPVLVYVRALETWFQLGLGEVVWRKGRWCFKHQGVKNTDLAHFANAGMPGWRHYREWKSSDGKFVSYAEKAKAAIEASRNPSRLTVGDIAALQKLVTQMLKHKGGVTRKAPEVSYTDLGGLLVALEDLKACVEVTR